MFAGHFRNIFSIPELRRKLLATFGLLIVYRIGFHIPIPGIELEKLAQFKKGTGAYQGILVFLSTISGGGLDSLSIFSLGIMPYISASIIFSLLVKVIPTLEEISKEGPSGQQKINQWTRMSAVPLCIVQSFFIIGLLRAPLQGPNNEQIFLIAQNAGMMFYISSVIAFTVGGIFLMWVGELITEYGVSNGISLLIMAGIVARAPSIISGMLNPLVGDPMTGQLVAFGFLFVLIVLGVTLVHEGQRRIPVQQAKHTRGRRVYGGQKSHMPIRVNQAGVMPVIFASSLMVFPSVILGKILSPGNAFLGLLAPTSFTYIILYIGMIYFFSYFWNSLMFQPTEMAKQMKEYGSFIPGIRPGRWTAEFLEKVMNRVTYVGAAFLAFIALIPNLLMVSMGLQKRVEFTAAYFLGGTGILIVVAVVLEFIQKVESHLMMRHYEGFIKKGGRGRTRR